MRGLISLVEEFGESSFFNPNEIYLHGGPSELTDGNFKRHNGGIFFAKDTDAGLKFAVNAWRKSNGGVWYCKINLKPDQVFDYANDNHLQRLQAVMDDKDYDLVQEKSQNWSIIWLKLPSGKKPEELLMQAGFRAAIVKAKTDSKIPNIFVSVFVPEDIEVINFVPKDQLMPKQIGAI